MTTPVSRNMVALIEGDSINDPTLFYVAFSGLRVAIDSFYNSPSGSSYRRPTWVNHAVSGTTTTNVAGRIAADLAVNAYTHVFLHIGVNDAQLGVPLATTQANCNTIKAACASAGVQLFVVGPLCDGEKWPTGQNAFDASLDAIDAAMATIFSGANITYISSRTNIYAVQEPIFNTPGPGAPSNIITHLIAASGPGLHPNQGGQTFYTKLCLPLISFT